LEPEPIFLFLKLKGSPRTIERFLVAHSEWAVKRLGAGPAQATATTPFTYVAEFGPYKWIAGREDLQRHWETVTREWPTLTATLTVGTFREDAGEAENIWRNPFENAPLAIWTIRVHRGEWDVENVTEAEEESDAFWFELSSAGPDSWTNARMTDADWTYLDRIEAIDGLEEQFKDEEAVLDALLAWRARFEAWQRNTPTDPEEEWMDLIEDRRIAAEAATEVPVFFESEDEGFEEDNAEPDLTPAPPSTASKTEGECLDEEVILPDDLPF